MFAKSFTCTISDFLLDIFADKNMYYTYFLVDWFAMMINKTLSLWQWL